MENNKQQLAQSETQKQLELSKKILQLAADNDRAQDVMGDANIKPKDAMKELLNIMVNDGTGFWSSEPMDVENVRKAAVHIDDLTNTNGDHLLADDLVCVDPDSDPYMPDSDELEDLYTTMLKASKNE